MKDFLTGKLKEALKSFVEDKLKEVDVVGEALKGLSEEKLKGLSEEAYRLLLESLEKADEEAVAKAVVKVRENLLRTLSEREEEAKLLLFNFLKKAKERLEEDAEAREKINELLRKAVSDYLRSSS